MGWLYSSAWQTPSAMRDHLRDSLTRAGHTIVKDASVAYGRRYYAAIRNSHDKKVTIFVALINGGRGDHGYGYKDMDESMGPCEKDCPLSLLALCDEPPNEWAKTWREEVRAYHAARTGQLTLAKSVQLGAKVWLRHTKDNPFTIRRIEGKKILGTDCKGWGLYRIPRNRIEKVEAPDA